MKHEVKRIGAISMLKIYAAIGLVIGLIYGVMIFLAMMFGALSIASLGGDDGMGAGAMVLVMGLIILVVAVIASAIMYGILGAICAIIYNIFASLVGGIELELNEKK